MAILDENEFTEVEGRSYVNPQVALDESNTFIDNLRSTQQANNQQIQTDTYNLGTEIPSDLGGLTGGEGYFTSRYQTPQTVSAVANLRATAQAAALNQALANEQEVWKKRYNDAYRKYQKGVYDKANNGSGSNSNNSSSGGSDDGESEKKTSKSQYQYNSAVRGIEGKYTVVTPDGKLHVVDMITGEETIIDPETNTELGSNGYGYSGGGGGGGSIGGR